MYNVLCLKVLILVQTHSITFLSRNIFQFSVTIIKVYHYIIKKNKNTIDYITE